MKKIILIILCLVGILHAGYKVLDDEIVETQAFLKEGSYKVLEFDKMISKVKIKNDEYIEVSFLKNRSTPLRRIKIFGKAIGKTTLFISFTDGSNSQIETYVTQDLGTIIALSKKISPDVIIEQTKGKVVLKGSINTIKDRDRIIDLFVRIGMDKDKDILDLSTIINPNKMIKIKLYAVEINNDKGLTLKNNWTLSNKNYFQVGDTLKENAPLGAYTNDSYNVVNNQRNFLLSDALDSIMANAVTLSGGLTGTANYLGKYFNAGLTLNYLSSQGVASILDETTLITQEEDKANFHAGGTIYIKLQTTNAEGLPITQVRAINYGLQLELKAKNIVNGDFVDLIITTKSTQIDWANQVDGIPSFLEKSIDTSVIIKDKATVILGGLINNSNAKDVDKIPFLGDIPILGFLFRSKAFQEGKSELVFFITPEIVDPNTNVQQDILDAKTKEVASVKDKFEDDK